MLSIGYAILRYHIAGTVPWKELPLYTLNKAIALSAFILLTFNFSFGPLKNLGFNVPQRFLDSRKAIGTGGFLLVIIHALISLLLFKTTTYDHFFHLDGTLTIWTSISMLAGISALGIFWVYKINFLAPLNENDRIINSRTMLLLALALCFLHLFFIGYKNWIVPSEWNGNLPPISLVAFVFFSVAYIINLVRPK